MTVAQEIRCLYPQLEEDICPVEFPELFVICPPVIVGFDDDDEYDEDDEDDYEDDEDDYDDEFEDEDDWDDEDDDEDDDFNDPERDDPEFAEVDDLSDSALDGRFYDAIEKDD